MDILDNYITKFLIQKPIAGYEKELNIFLKFLKEEKKIKPESIDYFLQGFRTDGVIESLDFYIKKNSLTSISTARRYSSCMQEFLRYIIHNEFTENKELGFELGAPSYDEKSYISKVNNYISNDKRLKETSGFIAGSKEDIIVLIDECNKTLNSDEIFEKAIKQQKYYNKFRSALILKLTLLTGIKYEVLRAIKEERLKI